jgi:hypothetical protein
LAEKQGDEPIVLFPGRSKAVAVSPQGSLKGQADAV